MDNGQFGFNGNFGDMMGEISRRVIGAEDYFDKHGARPPFEAFDSDTGTASLDSDTNATTILPFDSDTTTAPPEFAPFDPFDRHGRFGRFERRTPFDSDTTITPTDDTDSDTTTAPSVDDVSFFGDRDKAPWFEREIDFAAPTFGFDDGDISSIVDDKPMTPSSEPSDLSIGDQTFGGASFGGNQFGNRAGDQFNNQRRQPRK